MMISKLLKYYSLHYIYIPFVFIYFVLQGEDTNTILFASSLATIVSMVLYLYDVLITFLFSRIIGADRLILFLIPIVIMLVLFSELKKLIAYLDFDGDYFIYTIVITSLGINVFTFYSLKAQLRSLPKN